MYSDEVQEEIRQTALGLIRETGSREAARFEAEQHALKEPKEDDRKFYAAVAAWLSDG